MSMNRFFMSSSPQISYTMSFSIVLSSMVRHSCLMIFIFIIYGGFFIICGGYIIIRGDFFIIFGT